MARGVKTDEMVNVAKEIVDTGLLYLAEYENGKCYLCKQDFYEGHANIHLSNFPHGPVFTSRLLIHSPKRTSFTCMASTTIHILTTLKSIFLTQL